MTIASAPPIPAQTTSAVHLRRIDRQTLPELAYQQIRDHIIEGVFAPGEVLHFDALRDLLGMSGTPLRTALDRLAEHGLLERRWRLHVITVTAADAWNARETLGRLLRALEVNTDDTDAAITALRSSRPGDTDVFTDCRDRIRALCALSANTVLVEILDRNLDALLYRAQFTNGADR